MIRKKKEKHNKEAASAVLKMTGSQNTLIKHDTVSVKAIEKITTELPSSPIKQAVIVGDLASEFGYQSKTFRNKAESPNKEKIKQFFYRLDIVYTMPGKGDELTIWTEERKQKF